MTRTIYALHWEPTAQTSAADYVANEILNSDIDTRWIINISTQTDEMGRAVRPRWITLDNVANTSGVTLTFGPISFSVPAFKRIVFPMAEGTNIAIVDISSGVCKITFSENKICDNTVDNYTLGLPLVPTTLPVSTAIVASRPQNSGDYGYYIPFVPTAADIYFDLVDPAVISTQNGSLSFVENFGTKRVALRPAVGRLLSRYYTFANPMWINPGESGFVICDGGDWYFTGNHRETTVPVTLSYFAGSSTANFAHNLPTTPSRAEAWIRCKTAEHGYSIGDETVFTNMFVSGGVFYTTDVNFTLGSSNITARVRLNGGDTTYFLVVLKGGGTSAVATPSNWELFFKAWK